MGFVFLLFIGNHFFLRSACRLSWGELYVRPYKRGADRCDIREGGALLGGNDRLFSAPISREGRTEAPNETKPGSGCARGEGGDEGEERMI